MEVDKEMRILVVDDSKAMRNLVKTVLRKAGFHNLAEAEDGEEAWSLLTKQEFDLLMSDWNMPHMDGISLLRKVRESEELKVLPFLMVTAEGFKENVIEAVEAGVNGYIVKPFSPQAIEAKIEKIFVKLSVAA
jgi:two-component system, chemotaxis family, chemotaxis protein CheY